MRNVLEKVILRKVMRVKVFGTNASGSSIGYKKRRSKPMANKSKNGNSHRNGSKMCKTKPVLRVGGFKLDEAKIRAKGKV